MIFTFNFAIKKYHQLKRGIKTGSTKIPENYMTCYANVYDSYRVTGEWYLKSDYFADDIVEE